MKKILSILLVLMFGAPNLLSAESAGSDKTATAFEDITQGELVTLIGGEKDPNAFSAEDSAKTQALPLNHTSVESKISGFVARTYVTQEFRNPYKKPIEAIYNFPLPHEASVDSMEMQIGEKRIIGKIDTRKEAERKYQEAKQQGKTAALLNQERPNIFTQKIANIMPGDAIKIRISYFEVLKYEGGKYDFVFPMVVGPRYNPPSVEDAKEIESPTISAGTRGGHTIDLKLTINAGVNIRQLKSNSHDVNVRKIDDASAEVTLKQADEIPNKDFSFSYEVASDTPQIGFLMNKDKGEKSGYFTLLAEPQKAPKDSEIRSKEIVFVLDTSGSMSGRPIDTVKKAMRKAISNLRPDDSFNVYNFNTSVFTLAPEAIKADEEGKRRGLAYVDSLDAGGGTMMNQPFLEALKDKGDHPDRIRIILGMTDGDIGNDSQILNTVKTGLGSNRVFMFGVDAAANRYLIDKIAESGNGKATYVLREDDPEKKVDEFYETFASPVLTDIKVDWDGLNVSDILPERFADLYAGQPLVVCGKYSDSSSAPLDTERNIRITAKRGSADYSQTIKVTFKSEEKGNASIAAYWGRKKIDGIYKESSFEVNPKLEEEVTALGLKYAIMTQYTSFIAIDDTIRNASGSSETHKIPVYEVEGKDYDVVNGVMDAGNFKSKSAINASPSQSNVLFGANMSESVSSSVEGTYKGMKMEESDDFKNTTVRVVVIGTAILLGIIFLFLLLLRKVYRKGRKDVVPRKDAETQQEGES